MTEADYSLSLTAQRLREEFEAMPPKKQQETIERVQLAIVELSGGDEQKLHYLVEAGRFRVMIGASSEDIRLTGEFTVTNVER